MTAADPPGGHGASGRFQTTHWSVVLCAGEPPTVESREALTRLCELYWRPVHAYIRRRVATDDEARDLTQGFFTLFLEKQYVRDADPARGRFRSFLLASVKHFLSNDRDTLHALKRGGWTPIVSLEVETAEGSWRHEPATHVTPERLYEHRWAWAMVNRVLERLADEQAQAGRSGTFGRLRPYLVGDEPGMPYDELARLLDTSPAAVRVAVHRLRRRFRTMLLEEVARTVADPADIESEVRYLIEALRTPGDAGGSTAYARG